MSVSAPRPQQVRSRLEAMARAAGVGAKLPKTSELCRELSISRRTLDFALGELERDGIIERKHAVGIFVARRPKIESHLLLICHPDFFLASGNTPFWRLLLEAAKNRAQQFDGSFDIHFCRVDGAKSSLSPTLEREILGGEVAGVIGVGLREDLALWLESRIPFVSLAGWSNHMICFDLDSFIEQSVARLQSLGCARLGFVSAIAPHRHYDASYGVHDLPLQQFRAALHRHDLPFEASLCETHSALVPADGGEVSMEVSEQGFNFARRYFLETPREAWPDGLLVNDELLMQGIWRGLARANLTDIANRQVQFVSHANMGSPSLLDCDDLIDRVAFEPQEIVALLFETLEKLIAGTPTPFNLTVAPRLLSKVGATCE